MEALVPVTLKLSAYFYIYTDKYIFQNLQKPNEAGYWEFESKNFCFQEAISIKKKAIKEKKISLILKNFVNFIRKSL